MRIELAALAVAESPKLNQGGRGMTAEVAAKTLCQMWKDCHCTGKAHAKVSHTPTVSPEGASYLL